MKKCKCGSSKNLFYIRDPLSGACGWMCHVCNKSRFPKGSTVLMFKDSSHRFRARYYVQIIPDAEQDEILNVGEWGQKKGTNVVHVYIYSGWNNGSRNGVSSFNMGHPDSLEHLRANLDRIRLSIPMKDVVQHRGIIQTTLE